MRYLSLFSGIGGFEKGIEQAYESIKNTKLVRNERQVPVLPGQDTTEDNSGTDNPQTNSLGDYDIISGPCPTCIGYSEIDKYATQIYQKHFPNHTNYGDVTTISEQDLPDFEFLCGGFPCQSFSIAGKRGGFNDTRGTMFFHIARILKAKQPRLLLLENVKGLLSHDEGRTFATIIATLDELGYDCQWQVLNSKNHGVPQNRERVFIVGHLRGTRRPQVFPFSGGSQNDSEPSGNANTLTSNYWKGVGANRPFIQQGGDSTKPYNSIRRETPTIDSRIRRLTPTECARLQGFPDNWHKIDGISDTQAYKCYGNAVTVNVIEAIMRELLSTQH